MKIVFRIVLTLLISFSSFSIVFSQDFQTRASFGVSMDLTKDLRASLELGQRFRNNSMVNDRSLITGSVKYDLPKGFTVGGGARYMLVNSDGLLESRYRFHGDGNYRMKFSSFSVKLRERVQYGFDDIYPGSSNKLTSRSRVGVEYDIFGTPFSLYSSFEIYLVLNDPTSYSPYTLNKVVAGMSWNLPKKLNLKLYYLLEDELNVWNPQQAHIVVAALGLKL